MDNLFIKILFCLLLVFNFSLAYSESSEKIKLYRFFPAYEPKMDPNACPEFDNQKYFGPLRDQDGHGLCWSFAATSLIEEQLCRRDPNNCNKHLSVLDGARCVWDGKDGFMAPLTEGAYPNQVFDCVNQKKGDGGICLESDAPFDNLGAGCFLCSKTPKKTHDKAKKIYEDWIGFKNRLCAKKNISELELKKKFADEVGDILKKLEKYFPRQKDLGSNFSEAINSSDYAEFLRGILITDKCKNNRLKFDLKNKEVSLRESTKQPTEKDLIEIRDRFLITATKKKSMIINVCVEDGNANTFFSENGNCKAHALVVNAMKKENGVCKVNLRNSWGEGALLNGWFELDKMIGNILWIYYLE